MRWGRKITECPDKIIINFPPDFSSIPKINQKVKKGTENI